MPQPIDEFLDPRFRSLTTTERCMLAMVAIGTALFIATTSYYFLAM